MTSCRIPRLAITASLVLLSLSAASLFSALQSGSTLPNHPPTLAASVPVSEEHPRCVFQPEGSQGRTFSDVRALFERDATFRQIMSRALEVAPSDQHPAANAACWIVSNEDRFARTAMEQMLGEMPNESGKPYYSDIWSYALAYDWLFHHPEMTPERRSKIHERLMHRVSTELEGLDGTNMALWHGRNQAANNLMTSVLALYEGPSMDNILRRTLGHWIESMKALQFSEGWPEGTSYWIYNRAGPYALAADSFISSTGRDSIEGISVRQVMKTIGLWQLYQYGPNGVFEPYGDSAGSLRLGETGWWTVTQDYYARISRDSGVAAGADYFRNRSPEPYGKRPYQWYIALAYDPSARAEDSDYNFQAPEEWMRKNLPQSMLFGRDSYGVAFFRGEWGDPNEIFASFKAGDLLAHHDHYDAGHFSIQRSGNLAPQTGFYGGYFENHRLGYQIQTVSANSLLILAPGEFSQYLRRQEYWPWLSGGQRVISPTGFHCVNLDHFRSQLNQGNRLERATIETWESVPAAFDFIDADITASYNSTLHAEPENQAKVSHVSRQFLYLRTEEVFVVRDLVHLTDTRFRPRFVLHSLSKPITETEKILVGNRDNGILESRDRSVSIRQGEGELEASIVLPEAPRTYKIGGPDFNFYVEDDGDLSDGFDGTNLVQGISARGGDARVDQWRIEVEPENTRMENQFLTILIPGTTAGDDGNALDVELLQNDDNIVLLRVGQTLVGYLNSTQGNLHFQIADSNTAAIRLLLIGLDPNRSYQIQNDVHESSREGLLWISNPPNVDFDLQELPATGLEGN